MTGQLTACDRCPAQLRESQLWKVRVGREIRRFCDDCHDAWLLEDATGETERASLSADPALLSPQGQSPRGGELAPPKREFEWS